MGGCCCTSLFVDNKVHEIKAPPSTTPTLPTASVTAPSPSPLPSPTPQPAHLSIIHQIEWSHDTAHEWYERFPDSRGQHQSPIDIVTENTVLDTGLTGSDALQLNYNQDCFHTLHNNGRTFLVHASPTLRGTSVSGTALSRPYRFTQFHMHWGEDDHVGSEHLTDGTPFSAELHFVHWNFGDYKNAHDALHSSKHDGLLVLAIFLELGESGNDELDKFLNLFGNISLNEQTTEISEQIDAKNLFPDDLASFWKYSGSLTTPPCCESAEWIVFKKPISISAAQLAKLRTLNACKNPLECSDTSKIKQNFRKCCALNDRTVFRSFE